MMKNDIALRTLRSLKLLKEASLLFLETIRVQKILTGFLGPEFVSSHRKIEIDITYNCNLSCCQCNRFLDFAPSSLNMSVNQIKKFIKESEESARKWETILLSGGEAITHPYIYEIIDLLIKYKNNFSPATKLYLLTNGSYKTKIATLKPDISIIDSKKEILGLLHDPVTVAPIDLPNYKNVDYGNGCYIIKQCAMGLNTYGYYQCTVAAAIDRILGFNAGRKKLPSKNDSMIDLCRIFCKYCGHFIRSVETRNSQTISPTWKKIIENYNKSKPSLSLY